MKKGSSEFRHRVPSLSPACVHSPVLIYPAVGREPRDHRYIRLEALSKNHLAEPKLTESQGIIIDCYLSCCILE